MMRVISDYPTRDKGMIRVYVDIETGKIIGPVDEIDRKEAHAAEKGKKAAGKEGK